jgi:hypothetical protein
LPEMEILQRLKVVDGANLPVKSCVVFFRIRSKCGLMIITDTYF